MIHYAMNLRALAIFGVLLIHVSMKFVFGEVGTYQWWVGNVFDSLARWSVPIFFMLSGMLLLDKNETYREILSKRVIMLLIPLIVWTVLFSFWESRFTFTDVSVKEILVNLFENDTKYHLWYLYAIIGLYLALPLFKSVIKLVDKRDLYLFVLISFTISAIVTAISKIYGLQVASGFEYMLGYGSYLLLGYILANKDFNLRQEYLVYGISFVALLTTMIGTWYFSLIQDGVVEVFYDYLSLTTPIIAMGVFLAVKRFGNKKPSPIIKLLAKYSFGIYLIHPIFIDLFDRLFSDTMVEQLPVIYMIIVVGLTALLSLVSTLLFKKIPLIKRIV
ncbi:acyltransferase [Aquisalibacillus elongatus]|uniref:Surface polysaccharide O-acyltransferase-like enzyme n=1 Tax=Aquisalibacillus elongatus TaxID=485577 RepID=A0A3N5CBG3_9BACI|nr:acyltransferase family protein [Aquisalibacillus elongatus]RPF54171.1 surface polysaccharide O-acyltransferase-like enzyme [Aquisalibacillus elongatus]